jgi:hypothetical protein
MLPAISNPLPNSKVARPIRGRKAVRGKPPGSSKPGQPFNALLAAKASIIGEEEKNLLTTCKFRDCETVVHDQFVYCLLHNSNIKRKAIIQAKPSKSSEGKTSIPTSTEVLALQEQVAQAKLIKQLEQLTDKNPKKELGWEDLNSEDFAYDNSFHLSKEMSKVVVAAQLKIEENLVSSACAINATQGLWVQPEIVQRTQAFTTRYYLDQTTVKYFKSVLPHIQFIASRNQRSHDHPILNLTREIASNQIYNYLQHHVKQLANFKIVDIGANMNDNVRLRRPVHSLCPILSPADVFRRFHQGTGPNCCSHTAQECNCCLPLAYVAIHSLYYFTPEEILSLVERAHSKTLVAVVHVFDDAYGSFAHGEAKYQMIDPLTVSMNVNGNQHPYIHSNMSWMRDSHYTSKRNGNNLVWTKIGQVADQSIFSFKSYPGFLAPEKSIPINLTASVKDSHYYGPVSMAGAFNDAGKIAVPGQNITLADLQFYSWGSFIMAYQSTKQLTMMCPKELVAQCSAQINGKKRTHEMFATLLNYVRFNSQKYSIPPSMIDATSFVAACLGFVKNIALETSALYSIIKPTKALCLLHDDALGFKFQRVWNWKKVAVAATLAATSTAAIVSLPIVGHTVAPIVGLGWSFAAIMAYCRRKLGPAPDIYDAYRTNRSSNPPSTRVVPLPTKTLLPSTDPPKDINALIAMPVDETATVKIKGDITAERPLQSLSAAGIVTTTCIPVVPSNTAASSLCAIKERVTKPQPRHSEHFSQEFFDLYKSYTIYTFDDQFPGLRENPVIPLTQFVWRQPFPAAMQKVLEKAYQEVKTTGVDLNLAAQASGFVKAELLTKSDEDGVPSLAPRFIQSCKPQYNVTVAPFIKAHSKRLAKIWDINNSHGPMYTSGATAEEIGAAFQRQFELGIEIAAIEGDFARFDSTIHSDFQQFENELYYIAGAKDNVVEMLDAGINTGGQDKWGTTYKVDGTRYSGRPQTSDGNTQLQGTAIRFCIAFHHKVTRGQWLKPSELDHLYHLILLLLGDDNLLLGAADFIKDLFQVLPTLLRMLGLELEPKLHVGPQARTHPSFCSSLFYPVEGNKTVLGPMIGRASAKAGYYCNAPLNLDTNRLLRGDALGRLKDCSFIPFLRLLWNRVIELTSHIKQKDIFKTADMKRQEIYNNHVTVYHKACPATWDMINAVYGLTISDEKKYFQLLQEVKSLPCVVDFPPLAQAQVTDGVSRNANDKHFDTPTTTTLVGPSPQYKQLITTTIAMERDSVHAALINTRPFLQDLAANERDVRSKLISLIPAGMPDPFPQPRGAPPRSLYSLITGH